MRGQRRASRGEREHRPRPVPAQSRCCKPKAPPLRLLRASPARRLHPRPSAAPSPAPRRPQRRHVQRGHGRVRLLNWLRGPPLRDPRRRASTSPAPLPGPLPHRHTHPALRPASRQPAQGARRLRRRHPLPPSPHTAVPSCALPGGRLALYGLARITCKCLLEWTHLLARARAPAAAAAPPAPPPSHSPPPCTPVTRRCRRPSRPCSTPPSAKTSARASTRALTQSTRAPSRPPPTSPRLLLPCLASPKDASFSDAAYRQRRLARCRICFRSPPPPKPDITHQVMAEIPEKYPQQALVGRLDGSTDPPRTVYRLSKEVRDDRVLDNTSMAACANKCGGYTGSCVDHLDGKAAARGTWSGKTRRASGPPQRRRAARFHAFRSPQPRPRAAAAACASGRLRGCGRPRPAPGDFWTCTLRGRRTATPWVGPSASTTAGARASASRGRACAKRGSGAAQSHAAAGGAAAVRLLPLRRLFADAARPCNPRPRALWKGDGLRADQGQRRADPPSGQRGARAHGARTIPPRHLLPPDTPST